MIKMTVYGHLGTMAETAVDLYFTFVKKKPSTCIILEGHYDNLNVTTCHEIYIFENIKRPFASTQNLKAGMHRVVAPVRSYRSIISIVFHRGYNGYLGIFGSSKGSFRKNKMNCRRILGIYVQRLF